MQARLDPWTASPGLYKAMAALQAHVNGSGLEKPLLELVKLRASQINGCAFCIAMHTREARAAGESNERLDLLNAWREAPFYSERERVALAWTEALTLLTEGHAPDEVFAEARAQFSDKELADLAAAVVIINGWNRFCVAFRIPADGRLARGLGADAVGNGEREPAARFLKIPLPCFESGEARARREALGG